MHTRRKRGIIAVLIILCWMLRGNDVVESKLFAGRDVEHGQEAVRRLVGALLPGFG